MQYFERLQFINTIRAIVKQAHSIKGIGRLSLHLNADTVTAFYMTRVQTKHDEWGISIPADEMRLAIVLASRALKNAPRGIELVIVTK